MDWNLSELSKRVVLFVLVVFSLAHNVARATEMTTFSLIREDTLELRTDSLKSLSVRRGDKLTIETALEVLPQFSITSVRRSTNGNQVIKGLAEDDSVLIILQNARGDVEGSARMGNAYYRIFSAEDGVNIVLADGSFLRDRFDTNVKLPSNPRIQSFPKNSSTTSSRSSRPMQKATENSTVYPKYQTGKAMLDLLVYYEEGFEQDPELVVDFLIENTNTYFAQSNIEIGVRLVGLEPLEIPAEELQEDLLEKMQTGNSPFNSISADRAFFKADAVIALRQNRPESDDACGIAYVGVQEGVPSRDYAVALVHWKPLGSSSDRTFCSDSTFAHEIGHILGSLHERRLSQDGEFGAYAFSFGHFETGLQGWHTIMSYGDEPEYPYFSNPDVRECRFKPCGVAPGSDGSADNATGFGTVGHMLAGYESDAFLADAVSDFRYEDSCDVGLDPDGVARLHAFVNNSPFDVEMMHFTEEFQDGTQKVTQYAPGEFVAKPGQAYGEGLCEEADRPHPYGNQITSSWFTYREPSSKQAIEGLHLLWEDGYSGSYSTVRIATAEGGAVVGHTSRVLKSGQSLELSFLENRGFEFKGVSGTCPAEVDGKSVTVVDVIYDCRIQPVFEAVAVSGDTLRVSLEEPVANSVYSGVGNLRGWAVATSGIDKIEIWIDGVYSFDAPYGGARGDVGGAFPEIEGSDDSGFSLAWNYNNMDPGAHTIMSRAYDQSGQFQDSSAEFFVARFHKPFLGPDDDVDLGASQCTLSGTQISIGDAIMDGQIYDILLEWRTAAQDFQIIQIR